MAGYQRTLNPKRVLDAAEYLRLSPSNIMPGAVIIAVDEDYVSISGISSNLFSLKIVEDHRTFEEKLQELWGSFTSRLSNEELSSAGISYSTPSADDKEPLLTTDINELSATSSGMLDEAIDNGMEENDEDDEASYPTSYLASLANELTRAITDWDSLAADRQGAIRNYIEGVSKPGLIIDGQHRVFGAKDVSYHDVRLPVVLLPALAFSEQVFQFYVLNSKAKPLKPT